MPRVGRRQGPRPPSAYGGTHMASAAPQPKVHIAPMQCYTNRYLRFLLRLMSADCILWTEMEKAADVLAQPERRLANDDMEHPLVLQLGGDQRSALTAATRLARERGGFCEVNLNCGCPSITTGGADFGAALMLRARHTRELIEAIGDATGGEMAVSVKCRIGVHDALLDDGSVPGDSYDALREFVETVCTDTVCSHAVIHARSAILGGLSPSKNRQVPPLRYDYVHELAADMPELRVTLNGGLALDGPWRDEAAWGGGSLDGVMLGRSILRRPLDVWGVDSTPMTSARAPSRAAALERYARHTCRLLSTRDHGRGAVHVADVLAPLALVAQQLVDEEDREETGSESGILDSAEQRDVFGAVWEASAAILSESTDGQKAPPPASMVLAEAEANGEGLPMRKLTRMLGKGMGKKEANKLARNRAEALS